MLKIICQQYQQKNNNNSINTFNWRALLKSQQKNRKKNQIIKTRINLQNQSSIQKINNRKRIRNNTMLKILDRGKSSKITQVRKDKRNINQKIKINNSVKVKRISLLLKSKRKSRHQKHQNISYIMVH